THCTLAPNTAKSNKAATSLLTLPVYDERLMIMFQHDLRHDWTIQEIEDIYIAPLSDLVFRAAEVHRAHHRADEMQGCMLLSIKTGGCPEDCAYCPQSARYDTEVDRQDLMNVDETLAAAGRAREQGATRFCMGAAWRDVPNDKRFDRVLEMVRGVRALG